MDARACDAPALVRGLVGYAANGLSDEDGRPLGEVSSPLYEDVTTEVVSCPYPDGRRGQPMNRTALRQVSLVWPLVLETLRVLAGPNATVHRAWKVALVGISAPLLSPRPTSRALSALYKASLGLSQVTSTLLLGGDGVADTPFSELGSGSDFFGALDANRWLVGQIQVCAGTRLMLEQAGEALAGTAPPEANAPALALPEPERMAELAAATVAAQAGHLLLVDRLRARGANLPPRPLPPWLRAVMSEPYREIAHVRRFFPEGQTPEVLEELLGSLPDTEDQLEALLETTLRAISAK